MIDCDNCTHNLVCNREQHLKEECIFYEEPQGQCNQCLYYDGVQGVPGHAPCWHWNIGGVMWNDYCSRFEKKVKEEND